MKIHRSEHTNCKHDLTKADFKHPGNVLFNIFRCEKKKRKAQFFPLRFFTQRRRNLA